MKPVIDDIFLSTALNKPVAIQARRTATGGSINLCEILTLNNGWSIFLKTHSSGTIPGMYQAEAKALDLLAGAKVLKIPSPLYVDEDVLILDCIAEGNPAFNWQEQLGRGLALLHKGTQRQKFGFDCDNYLGTIQQKNNWQVNWLDFWRDQRLCFQLDLYRKKTGSDDSLLVLGEKLLARLEDILACDPEPAVLLHGDLWSGNAVANEKGEPVIFDPASYYGHREAEFGMMRLFGGFNKHCEEAYQEVWPLQPGFDRRIEVYKLYHQLNHLNLFGSSYYEGCLGTLRTLLK